jgi:methyltransferase-like protein
LGRQTKVVDLSLTGNLMNSIRTVNKGTEVVITIQEDKKKLDDIQKRHSGKLNRTVLTLSEEEEKIANELSVKLILEDLKTIFNAK